MNRYYELFLEIIGYVITHDLGDILSLILQGYLKYDDLKVLDQFMLKKGTNLLFETIKCDSYNCMR
jgi:hypothetical protein